MALFDLPATRADLPVLQAEAERFRNDFDRVIVLGTGGSSLGAMALTAIGVPDGPELIFLDNFEPYGLDRALAGDLSEFVELEPDVLPVQGRHPCVQRRPHGLGHAHPPSSA